MQAKELFYWKLVDAQNNSTQLSDFIIANETDDFNIITLTPIKQTIFSFCDFDANLIAKLIRSVNRSRRTKYKPNLTYDILSKKPKFSLTIEPSLVGTQ